MAQDLEQKFGFRIEGVDDLQKLMRVLNLYKTRVDDVNKIHALFSNKGEATRITMQGITKDANNLTVTFQKTKEGWEQVNKVIDKYVNRLTIAETITKRMVGNEKKAYGQRVAGGRKDLQGLSPDLKDQAIEAISRKGITPEQQSKIIAGFIAVNKIRRDELALIAQKNRVEGEYSKASQARFNLIRNHEQGVLTLKQKVQAQAVKDSKITFDQIRQSERLAAYTRRTEEEQRKLLQGFKATGAAGKKAGNEVLISWLSVQRLFVVQLLHQAIAQLRLAFQAASQQAFDFSKRVGEIRTLSQVAGETTEVWNQALIRQSNLWGIDLLDVTKAEYEALSNQIVHSANQMEFLSAASKLALVTNSDLTVSVDAVSSVLNSFKLSTLQAERVAAVLFRTVDLGKTTLPELAQNLGRVNSLSKLLGVSFEEQQAALSTLTIQGLEDHTAKTLLVNIYQKLIRPTKEMEAIFHEWGVTTGQAAIQTYGLGEVLSRLVAHAEKSGNFAKVLGEEFQELRATTGIATYDLDTFTQSLAANNDAASKYVSAFAKVNETEGRKIQIQITALKNLFIGFGTTINRVLLNFADIFGGASKTVITLSTVIFNLVVTWGSLKAVSLSVAAAQLILNGRFTSLNFILQFLQGRIALTTAAFGLLRATITGLIPVAVFGLVSLITYQLQWKKRVEESAEAVGEAFNKLNRESVQIAIQNIIDWGKDFQTTSSNIFKRLSELNISFQQEANSMHVVMKDLNKAFISNINDLFKGQVSIFKSRISSLKKEITELNNQIEKNQAKVREINLTKDDIDVQRELDLKQNDVPAQVKILQQAIKDNLKAAKDSIATGDPKNFEKTLDFYKKAYDYQQDIYKLQVQQNNKGEINAAANEKLRILNAQTNEIERQNKLHQEQINRDDKELEKKQAQLKSFQDNFAQLKKFDTKKGTLEEFDALTVSLEKAGKASNLSIGEQLQLFQLIEQHRKDFLKELEANSIEKQAAQNRATAAAQQKVIDSARTAAEKSLTEFHETLTKKQEDFFKNLDRLRNIYEKLGPQGGELGKESKDLFNEIQRDAKRIDTLQKNNDFAGVDRVTKELQIKIERLSKLFFDLGSLKNQNPFGYDVTGKKYDPFQAIDPLRNPEIDKLLHNLVTVFKDLNGQINNAVNLQAMVDKYNEAFSKITESMKALDAIQAQTSTDWVRDQTNINNQVDLTIAKMNELVKSYERLAAERKKRHDAEETDVPQIKWGGGRIGHYYSGGRGTDTQLAYLTPGEYVWDRETTKKMYPYIRGMHQISKYTNVNSGGNSSYNFGNINVTNSNSSSGEAMGKQIIREIKRAIRTGNLQI